MNYWLMMEDFLNCLLFAHHVDFHKFILFQIHHENFRNSKNSENEFSRSNRCSYIINIACA